MHAKFKSEKLKGRGNLESTGIVETIILNWILGKSVGGCGLD
jgi:hypothetical protein